jgi:hypothetical protein
VNCELPARDAGGLLHEAVALGAYLISTRFVNCWFSWQMNSKSSVSTMSCWSTLTVHGRV